MTVSVEKKFVVEIVYNGVEKPIQVEPEEQVTALLQKAIATFGITQNPHLLSLFREDGTVVPENESVERAGLKPGETLLLRPNTVKGGGVPVFVTTGLLRETFETLRECGRRECECVVYWTGDSRKSEVEKLEHPIHRRSPFGYEVNSEWLTTFWKLLAASKRSVKAQIHTHPRNAFHSTADDTWPIISQVGFISVVIPDFANGEPSLDSAWVGRLRHDGTWARVSREETIAII